MTAATITTAEEARSVYYTLAASLATAREDFLKSAEACVRALTDFTWVNRRACVLQGYTAATVEETVVVARIHATRDRLTRECEGNTAALLATDRETEKLFQAAVSVLMRWGEIEHTESRVTALRDLQDSTQAFFKQREALLNTLKANQAKASAS
jgi:hypothetical protein